MPDLFVEVGHTEAGFVDEAETMYEISGPVDATPLAVVYAAESAQLGPYEANWVLPALYDGGAP